jgi:hypothetical protein
VLHGVPAAEKIIAMTAIWKFRLLACFILVFVGATSVANLVAEVLSPLPPTLPLKGSKPPLPDQVSSASLASSVAPFRSDLRRNYALSVASQVLSGKSADERIAKNAIADAFKLGPHDARLWLVLALLQARANPVDPLLTESLKMSYLTGPNLTEVIPARLETVTATRSLNDSDLGELARGDVRAMLTQLPGQRLTLVNAYPHASEMGKRFLEESVKQIDPEFVGTLRGSN